MTIIYKLLATTSFVAYDDDPAAAEKAAAEKAAAEKAAAEKAAAEQAQTFTKADMDKALAEERRKGQELNRQTMAELEAVRPKLNMTKQERDELDARMKDLTQKMLTKDEIASQEANRLRKAHENKVTELEKEKDDWQQRYTQSFIDRSITDAAVEFDAYSPSQVVTLLRQDTRLVPKLDAEGNATDQFEPKISFSDKDKDGKPVILELSPQETLKRMKETEGFLNLFKGTGKGGLGGNNQGAGKKQSAADLAKDPAAYRAARKSGELTFGAQ